MGRRERQYKPGANLEEERTRAEAISTLSVQQVDAGPKKAPGALADFKAEDTREEMQRRRKSPRGSGGWRVNLWWLLRDTRFELGWTSVWTNWATV